MNINELIKKIKKYNPKSDEDLIRLAFDYAKNAHGKTKRKNGKLYITHPLETVNILADMKMDDTTIIGGLLHDVPEDTDKNLNDIKKEFGKEIANLVEGITKLGQLKYRGVDRYIENLRKMFVAMASDVRTIIIKFADRLNNLQTLDVLPPNKQKRISLETIEIYAPIAARLGIGEIKGQLEDSSFPYAYPNEYKWLQKKIKPNVVICKKNIDKMQKKIKKILNNNKIKVQSIHGRVKHLFSLYKKLIKYNKDISKIHDLVALRIIVPTVSDCYAAIGIIHQHFTPLKGNIKDYISQPKPSGYRSLHTTIFCDDGKIMEIQIRTPKMHTEAEFGIAAHWHYTEIGKTSKKKFIDKEKIAWIDQLVKFQKDIQDEQQYLESLKIEFFKNRIFCFTPKGDVINLPEDSIPIDFAYHIHSELGNSYNGVKINEIMKNIDTPLKNGDMVEIIVNKKRRTPSSDWLRLVKTTTAKNKIKQALAREKSGVLKKVITAAENRFEYVTKTKKINKKKKKKF